MTWVQSLARAVRYDNFDNVFGVATSGLAGI